MEYIFFNCFLDFYWKICFKYDNLLLLMLKCKDIEIYNEIFCGVFFFFDIKYIFSECFIFGEEVCIKKGVYIE